MQQADPWNPASPIRQDCWSDFLKQKQVVFDHLAYLDTTKDALKERAKDLRNTRLAHLSPAEVLSASTPLVLVQELEQLADGLLSCTT